MYLPRIIDYLELRRILKIISLAYLHRYGNQDSQLIYLFLKKFILFIYFWLHWVFIAARGLSLVAADGGYPSLRCVGFSLRWLLLLRSMGSRCMGFCSCDTRAQ